MGRAPADLQGSAGARPAALALVRRQSSTVTIARS
jgi:hypothetical protein